MNFTVCACCTSTNRFHTLPITFQFTLVQKLCDSRYICHASGDFSHKFIYGSYIYCVTAEKNQEPESKLL